MIALTLKSPVRLAALAALAFGTPALAQDAPEKAESFEPAPVSSDHRADASEDNFKIVDDGLHVKLYLWAWLTGYYGDAGVMGQTAKVDSSFRDILDDTDSVFAFSGRIEVHYKKFGAYFDGLYTEAKINDLKDAEGMGNTDLALQQAIVDFGLMYRIGDWEAKGDAARNSNDMTLDLYAGGRYNGIELTVNPLAAPEVSGRQDWVDPVIGLKFVAPLSKSWHAEVSGDIGGFGVASDFTWSATAVLGYDFTMFNAPSSFLFGFKAIGWDYSDGSGDSKFEWDITQAGLLLGLSIRF